MSNIISGEGRESPTKVSSTQRQSVMVGSFTESNPHDGSLGYPEQSADSLQSSKRPNGITFIPPPSAINNNLMTPISSYSPPVFPSVKSPYEESSSASAYSGVADEAIEAVHVRNFQMNNDRSRQLNETMSSLALNHDLEDVSSTDEKEPRLPDFPTEDVLRKTSYATKLPDYIKEQNVTSVETIIQSPGCTDISYKNTDIEVIPSYLNGKIEHNKIVPDNEESVEKIENELASLNIHDENHSKELEHSINYINGNGIIEVSDTESIISSIILPLETHNDSDIEDFLPLRTEVTEVTPIVPPRSQARPKACPLSNEEIKEEMKQKLVIIDESKEMENNDIRNHKSLVSFQSTSNNSESYYSADNFIPEDKSRDLNDNELSNEEYLLRRLRELPLAKNVVRPSSTAICDGMLKETPTKINADDLENMYEDIHPASLPPKKELTNMIQLTPKNKKKPSKKTNKKHKKKDVKEIRKFDTDTITQLLNVTKGTLVGSEFSNLGMQTKEKQLLERLVDSLSRLTADMILEPTRFDEGIRRLNKATRALEGFDK